MMEELLRELGKVWNALNSKKEEKYVGVVLDNKFTLKPHVEEVTRKNQRESLASIKEVTGD